MASQPIDLTSTIPVNVNTKGKASPDPVYVSEGDRIRWVGPGARYMELRFPGSTPFLEDEFHGFGTVLSTPVLHGKQGAHDKYSIRLSVLLPDGKPGALDVEVDPTVIVR